MTKNISRRTLFSLAAGTASVGILLSSPAIATQIRPTHQVNNNMSDGFLNMRWGPGTRHGIIRRLFPGEYLVRHRVRGRWMRVSLLDDHTVTGWVHVNYIRNLSRVGSL